MREAMRKEQDRDLSNVQLTAQRRRGSRQQWLVLLGLASTLLLVALLSLVLGAIPIPPAEIAAVLLGHGNPDYRAILLDYRLARVLIGALIGAGLSVAGTVIQTLLRNPLASPGTLGITAGAGLGAVMVALLLPASMAGMMSPAAMVGGAAVALAIYFIAYRGGIDPIRLALVGVAMGAFCSAGIDLILLRGSANLATALVWLTGSLWGRGWSELFGLLPWIGVLLPVVWRLALQLDLLQLGEAAAQGLGMRVAAIRLLLFCAVVGLAGASVSAAGTIGFVGLISPHMARLLVCGRHRILLPTAALCGSSLVLAADLCGRLLRPPLEIPAGLIISAVGAPFFIYLLWRVSRKRR